MSTNEPEQRQGGVLERAYRTVSPRYESRGDVEMDAIGWTMFLVMAALFVPFLPLVLVVWLVSKAVEAAAERR